MPHPLAGQALMNALFKRQNIVFATQAVLHSFERASKKSVLFETRAKIAQTGYLKLALAALTKNLILNALIGKIRQLYSLLGINIPGLSPSKQGHWTLTMSNTQNRTKKLPRSACTAIN